MSRDTGGPVMETLFKLAVAVWNPIPEIERRLQEGRLTIREVLPLFVPIVVAGGLAVSEAQSFFFEAAEAVGAEILDSRPVGTIFTNEFARRLVTVFGMLAPAGAVAFLPSRIFAPADRSTTVASLIVLSATFVFYAVALGILVHFISGVIVLMSAELGLYAFIALLMLYSILLFWIMIRFWIPVLLDVIKLPGRAFAIVSVCFVGSWFVFGVFSSYLYSL